MHFTKQETNAKKQNSQDSMWIMWNMNSINGNTDCKVCTHAHFWTCNFSVCIKKGTLVLPYIRVSTHMRSDLKERFTFTLIITEEWYMWKK